VIVPKERLPSGRLPISFKPEELAEMITIGEKDAQEAIDLGAGMNGSLYVEHANKLRFEKGFRQSFAAFVAERTA
jgi:hypothetical protein